MYVTCLEQSYRNKYIDTGKSVIRSNSSNSRVNFEKKTMLRILHVVIDGPQTVWRPRCKTSWSRIITNIHTHAGSVTARFV